MGLETGLVRVAGKSEADFVKALNLSRTLKNAGDFEVPNLHVHSRSDAVRLSHARNLVAFTVTDDVLFIAAGAKKPT